MIIDFNLMVLVCFIAIYIFSRSLICFINGTNLNVKNEITNLSLYMSVVFVFSATLFPIKLNVAYEGFEIYNLIPLKVPIGIFMKNSFGYFLYQTLGNIALFVPFGFFVYSKSRYNMKKTIICCFALTLFIELIQGFIPYRFCEIDDLWLNTLGGFIGAIIYIYYLKFNDKYKKINNIN